MTSIVAIRAIEGIDAGEAAIGGRFVAAGGRLVGEAGVEGWSEEGSTNVSGGRLSQSSAIGRLRKQSVGQISGHPHSRGVWPTKSQLDVLFTKPVSRIEALFEHKSNLFWANLRLKKVVVLR